MPEPGIVSIALTSKKLRGRLLLNLKKSGVTSISVKAGRPELSRILDVISQILSYFGGGVALAMPGSGI